MQTDDDGEHVVEPFEERRAGARPVAPVQVRVDVEEEPTVRAPSAAWMSSERTWAGYAPWTALVKPNGRDFPRSRAWRPFAQGHSDRLSAAWNRMTGQRALACRVVGLAILAVACRAGSPRTSDELVPFDQNAARHARLIRHAQLTTVPGAGHFVLMPVCTLPGRLVAAAVCIDIATSPDRAAVHEATAATLVRFFRRTLSLR